MLPKDIQLLIDDLSSLPGIGPKSATRMAMHLLESNQHQLESLGENIKTIKKKVKHCERCNNFAESKYCSICKASSRDSTLLMVVETPLDIIAFEESGYKGYYHVLGGVISPMRGIGPDQLSLNQLIARLTSVSINGEDNLLSEIVIACSTSLEGEATAAYVRNSIREAAQVPDISITRIALGLPTNSSIEYQDSQTLQNALNHRVPL